MTSKEIREFTFSIDDITTHADAQTRMLAGIFKMVRESAAQLAEMNEARKAASDDSR